MAEVMKCDFRIHDWIDGKYKVERVLGHSATDSKFKTVDRDGRQYMLKLMNVWRAPQGGREIISRCSDSEIAGCMIASRYLTRIVAKGNVGGNPYVATEFVPSTDLSRAGRLNPAAIGGILRKILYGLHDLHTHGKVHSRLSPENVLLIPDGRVLLTNYIVLGARNPIDGDNAIGQTPYIAPELMVSGRSATILPTVDIYAFGVLAFRLLTGQLPYGNSSAADWRRSLLGRDAAKWTPLFEATLDRDPETRAANVEDVLALLPDDGGATSYEGVENERSFSRKVENGLMLRVMQGEDYGRIYRLGELMGGRNILTVGREDESVFNLMPVAETLSNYISRRHCTIERDIAAGKWYVRDGQWDKDADGGWVDSLNGTFVNSRRVGREGTEIRPGDIVSVGDVNFRVEGY